MNNLTDRVISAYSNFNTPRSNQLMKSLIQHLHSFVVDVQLTNQEWEFCWDMFLKMAKFTDESRNEFLLMADILGVSQLIEEVNHLHENEASNSALVGPYFRANAPFRKNGDAIMSDATEGEHLHIHIMVKAIDDSPIAGATVEVWQAATNGLYECEDSNQPDMNLRGRFSTDKKGEFSLIALMPTAYPVPSDGPAGDLLKSAKRNLLRPAHIHFIVVADGYETLVTQVFVQGDHTIEEDPVFTASDNMAEQFIKKKDTYNLKSQFILSPGESIYPEAPIK